MIVQVLGIIEKVEGGYLDASVLRGAVEVEVLLIAVKPQHKIASTVESGKFDIVRCVGPIADVLTVTVRPLASGIVMQEAPGRWRRNGSIPSS
jgi:hypothetical protein